MVLRNIRNAVACIFAMAVFLATNSSPWAMTPMTVEEFDGKTLEEQSKYVSGAVIEIEDFYRNKKSDTKTAQCISGLFFESSIGANILVDQLDRARYGDSSKHHVERIILGIIKQQCIDN